MNTESPKVPFVPYIPPEALNLGALDYHSQLRLGLQGPPASSKTWSSTTFPYPIFMSLNRGLVSHIGNASITEVPFYDDTFVNKLAKKETPTYTDFNTGQLKIRPANRKDAILRWLYNEGQKLKQGQTLVFDNSTDLEAAYHTQYWTDPQLDRDNKIKPYAEFRLKIDYFTEVMMLFRGLACDVIYICHESPDRDERGNLNGKVRPLHSGAFQDQLISHFTDWYRCFTVDKPNNNEESEKLKKKYECNDITLKEWIASTDLKCGSFFLWQTQPDSLCACRTSLINAPKYILAGYNSITCYQRKVKTK